MHYVIKKHGNKWRLVRFTGGILNSFIADFDSRKEAMATGRLLAGRRGSCSLAPSHSPA